MSSTGHLGRYVAQAYQDCSRGEQISPKPYPHECSITTVDYVLVVGELMEKVRRSRVWTTASLTVWAGDRQAVDGRIYRGYRQASMILAPNPFATPPRPSSTV